MDFYCRRYSIKMGDHCGLLGHTQCHSCKVLDLVDLKRRKNNDIIANRDDATERNNGKQE